MANTHNDDSLINKYLNNQLTTEEWVTFNDKLKDQVFRENLLMSKMIHLGQNKKEHDKNPMQVAFDTFYKLKEEIQEIHPIKLSEEDAIFLASLKNNQPEEELRDLFDYSDVVQYEEWTKLEAFVGADSLYRRGTDNKEAIPIFEVLAPQNKDNFEDELTIQLKEALSVIIHIHIYDNIGDYPTSLKSNLPFILPIGETKKIIDITPCKSGRYYIKLEAEGYKKVMRVVWII